MSRPAATATSGGSIVLRLLKWFAVLSLLTCGCCGGGFTMCAVSLAETGEGGGFAPTPVYPTPDTGHWQWPPSPSHVDLGEARFPLTATSPVQRYAWTPPATADSYELRYVLASEEAQQLEEKFLTYSRQARRRCPTLECAYTHLIKTHDAALDGLADRFLERARSAGLKQDGIARLIISFIQQIEYEIPKDQPYEVLPPALVVSEGRGDCDSKAVLAIILLRKAGIPCAVLVSDTLAHAAIGVALPGTGPSFRSRGQSLQYVELTATGWEIGMVPPKYDNLRLWEVDWVGAPPRVR